MNHYPKLPVSIFRLSPVSVAHGAEDFEDSGDVGGFGAGGPKAFGALERGASCPPTLRCCAAGAWSVGVRRAAPTLRVMLNI